MKDSVRDLILSTKVASIETKKQEDLLCSNFDYVRSSVEVNNSMGARRSALLSPKPSQEKNGNTN